MKSSLTPFLHFYRALLSMPDHLSTQSAARTLVMVKAVHTFVWAVFAGCIIAIPVAAWNGAYTASAWLAAIVAAEVAVLALNKWSCPLTSIAARYTHDRRDNFDIYLPEWLARHNKRIFGPLYVAGIAFTVALWVR